MSVLGIADLPTLVVSTLVFLALPGPGTFALIGAAARGGRAGGFAALAGLMLGDVLLMALAATGVSALLAAHPSALSVVRLAGVAYLAWIGLQLLRPRGDDGTAAPSPPHPGRAGFFRQAFLVTLVNPKAIVFYMAFFPLFIDPQRHLGAITFGAMGATISGLTLAYGSLLVVAGDALARRLAGSPRIGRLARRGAGVVLLAFGARMATP